MEHTRQGLLAAGMGEFAEEAHWFEFSELWQIPEVVRDFGKEMAIKGILDLPYAKTIFWCSRSIFGREVALLCTKVDEDFSGSSYVDLVRGKAGRGHKMSLLEVRYMMEQDAENSVLFPAFLISRHTGDICFRPNEAKEAQLISDEMRESGADEPEWWRKPARWLAELNGALISRDIELIRVGPPERKIRRDIARGRKPNIVYHVLSLKPGLRREVAAAMANGADRRQPPRLHWRRGHFRDVSGGAGVRLVPVAPSIVGAKDRGMVLKDYSVNAT